MTDTDTTILTCQYCTAFKREAQVPCGDHMPPGQVASWHEDLATHIRASHISSTNASLVNASKRPFCSHPKSGRAR